METDYSASVAIRFGPRLRELRSQSGLTQAELATKAGIRQASITDYERGKTDATWTMVVRLAHALGVTPDAFLREAETAKENRNPG